MRTVPEAQAWIMKSYPELITTLTPNLQHETRGYIAPEIVLWFRDASNFRFLGDIQASQLHCSLCLSITNTLLILRRFVS